MIACEWCCVGCTGVATSRVVNASGRPGPGSEPFSTFSHPFYVCAACLPGVEMWLDDVKVEPLPAEDGAS